MARRGFGNGKVAHRARTYGKEGFAERIEREAVVTLLSEDTDARQQSHQPLDRAWIGPDRFSQFLTCARAASDRVSYP